jgi:hypothetical protein
MNRIKRRTDVMVGRDFRHAERRPAIGGLAAFLKRTLAGKKRPRLHEEQRKRRQADVRHRIDRRGLPLAGKDC